ncbi:hypothetical protein GCM10011584_08270 [Nocardioides phosphati]|uniref:Cardiolipin synthase N-terminal domain-containing protein n=1 Tax=Nocardioides phosphati TaxID=1867775 RepID=A0ABQ2N8V6_9ACTN|nr:PLDc N-terminal domain-containing protein [Nocardioides phosphati]GGO86296.1 hypothetical protein GCM10011584_08270 [Nocardioides phosphati]
MNASPAVLLPTLLVTVALTFWAWCLVDLVRTDERDVRALSKPAWLVIVVLGSAVGGAFWCVLGRPAQG